MFHGRLILAFLAIVVLRASHVRTVAGDHRRGRGRTDQSAAVRGARLRGHNTPAFSETDDEGRFLLAVPDGKYTLAASLVGYALIELEIEVRAGVAGEVTIRLPEGAGTYTEHVTVIGRARDEQRSCPCREPRQPRAADGPRLDVRRPASGGAVAALRRRDR